MTMGEIDTEIKNITGDASGLRKEEPVFAIDRWVQESGLQNILNCLLVDVVVSRPKNVMKFIHEWSAPSTSEFGLSGTGSAGSPSTTGSKFHQTCERSKCSTTQEKEAEELFIPAGVEASPSEGEDTSVFDGDEGKVSEREESSIQRDVEPTKEQLLEMFPEEATSPYEFLRSDNHPEVCGPWKRLSSARCGSITACIGRGNYGIVVPAKRKPLAAEDAFGTEDVARCRRQKYEGLLWNGTPTAASVESRRVAIKISRIRGRWTLDESNVLRAITDTARELEVAVLSLEAQLDRLRHEVGVVESHENTERVAPFSDEDWTCLEERLRRLRVLLTGSQHVVKLVGGTMYSVRRDALLFPLELFPTSLGDCIRQRSEVCKVSLSTGCPFPSQNTAGGSDTTSHPLFTVRELQHVARCLCQALYFLNESCNLCHLDVKVDNILLSRFWPHKVMSGDSALDSVFARERTADNDVSFPRVVLTDFGLAQPLGTPVMQLGDFSTMAPEVYWAACAQDSSYEANRTQTFVESCDMWSVGCVLLRMLNGLDYAAWDPVNIFMVMEENFVSPALRHPAAWPCELNDFVVRCFERDPRRRMTPVEALSHPFLSSEADKW